MITEIARLELRLRVRSMLGYALGMAAYSLVIVAMYPTVKSDASLGALTENDPTVAALLGVSGSLTSPVGWVSSNLYANFFPLVVLLMTIGFGAATIAGQCQAGTLAQITALPLTRRRIVTEKVMALGLLTLPVALITMTSVLVGRRFDVDLGIWPLTGSTIAVVLLGIDFGLLAMLVGSWSGNRTVALGLTSAVAAVSYLVSSLGPVLGLARAIRPFSLFYWAVGNGQLDSGPTITGLVVLVIAGVLLHGATLVRIDRLDIR